MAKIDCKARRIVLASALLALCVLLAHVYLSYTEETSEGVVGQRSHNEPLMKLSQQTHLLMVPQRSGNLSSESQSQERQAAVQTKRKTVLREACGRQAVKSQDVPVPSMYTKQHIYVVDDYKAMYCFVPKVGCSNWKRVLMVLNGEKESVDGLTSEEVHKKTKLRFLSTFTADEQAYRLRHYHKFFFVREPFKRALSVYRNKFEDKANYRGNRYFHKFGKQIVRRLQKNPSFQDLKTGENVAWMDFVNYLVNPSVRAKVEESDVHYSDHWTAMHKICSPCAIDYDVIGNLETVTEDAQNVLDLLKAPSQVHYLSSASSRPTNSSDDGTYHRYFSQLNNIQLSQLWELYRLDYELFGYPKPDIVPE